MLQSTNALIFSIRSATLTAPPFPILLKAHKSHVPEEVRKWLGSVLKNEDLLCTCCLFPLPDAVLSFVTPVAEDAWDSGLRSKMVIRLLVRSSPGISQVGETFPSRSLAPHTTHSVKCVMPILTSYPQSLKPTCDALADDSDPEPSGGATTCSPKPSLKDVDL